MAKITLDLIKQELEQKGWKVLSEEYKNLDTDMEFECPEGHYVTKTWGKLRGKCDCPICSSNTLKTKKEQKISKKGKNITLALDQATRITGYSIYYDTDLVKYGTFETNAATDIERYKTIKEWLISMIELYEPSLVALEGIQLQEDGSDKKMGVTTFQMLAELLGILKETCYELGVRFEICHTATWRQHCKVKGKKRADRKRSMQILVKEWYDVSVTEDEADAVGIGRYAAQALNKKVEIVNWE